MAWQDREVPMPRAAEIAAHVGECAGCAEQVRRFAAASAALQAWRIDATPPAVAPALGRPNRRLLYWAAAAVVIVGLLSTVRVECASAPTCDNPRLHFSFMPSAIPAGDIPRQSRSIAPGAQGGGTGAPETLFLRDWNARRPVSIGIPAQGAKVLVVIFLDWQCPACKAVHGAYLPIVDALNREQPGSIRVVTRDYPLNVRCNPNVPVEMHPAACEAAVAVRLAREKHRDTEMINWLFARQEELTPALVRQGASDVAGITDLAARYPAVVKDVMTDADLGRRLEVHGTPTVFVNGILARTPENGLFSPQQFELALRAELRKK